MKYLFIVLIALLGFSSCTNNNDGKRILEANDYTDIEFTGYSWFSCSEKDFYATGFKAKSPKGHEVKGCVCSGLLFKNSTIRFD